MTARTLSAAELIDRLVDATNRHDLDGLADCFAPEFVNETPVHPARSFTGREQVLRNWGQIFAGVPDLETTILRRSIDGETVWTEWEMRGTRLDASAHLMRGVGIFGVSDGRFGWIRFYLEPVDQRKVGVDQAVREHLQR
jgi:limonene-1,2-epoxide hydrolase